MNFWSKSAAHSAKTNTLLEGRKELYEALYLVRQGGEHRERCACDEVADVLERGLNVVEQELQQRDVSLRPVSS